ncbi:MAG: metallophosphoesterase [Bacteroidota bacterium]
MMDRRRFLKHAGLGLAGSLIFPALSRARATDPLVTILFTNDLHSRIDPRREEARDYPSAGGFEQLARSVENFREEGREIVLLDAGDVVDARSIWVERWGGDVEYRWIQETGYDAVALGDQELMLGMETLGRLGEKWSPPWVVSNYRVSGTPLESHVEPYRVIDRGGIRIGIFALGSPIPQSVSGDLAYGQPRPWAVQMVRYLRERRLCDYCICLSHLGYRVPGSVDDLDLARETPGLDLVIGGHSHTLLEEPVRVSRSDGSEALIVQAGSGGVHLGRVDLCRTGCDEDQRVISCVQP